MPSELRPSLLPLFRYLREERRREHRKLVNALEESSYNDILNDWERFLNTATADLPPASNADHPAIRLVSKYVGKTYGKGVSRGVAITGSSPGEELHTLRIDCKKLRYLMEFFQSLYPHETIGRLINQLKNLQANLGDFKDLSVQQESLQQYVRNVVPNWILPRLSAD